MPIRAQFRHTNLIARDADGSIMGATYKISAFTLKGMYVKQDNGGALRNLKTSGFGGAYDATADLTLDPK